MTQAPMDLVQISERVTDALTRLERPFGVFLIDHGDPMDTRMAYITESRLKSKHADIKDELEGLVAFMRPDNPDAKGAALIFHRNGIHDARLIAIASPARAKAVTVNTPEESALIDTISETGAVPGDVEMLVAYWDVAAGQLVGPNYNAETHQWETIRLVSPDEWMFALARQLSDNYKLVQEALSADLEAAERGEITTDDIEYGDALRTATHKAKEELGGIGGPRVFSARVVVDGKSIRTPVLMYPADGVMNTIILDQADMPPLTASVIKALISSGDREARVSLLAIKKLLNTPIISMLLERSPAGVAVLNGDEMEELHRVIFGEDAPADDAVKEEESVAAAS